LEDEAHLTAQAGEREVAEVVAVEGDPPLTRVVEAGDEHDEGRLPHPGRADEGHHRPGGDVEVDVLEHHLPLAVAEAHSLEPDRALRPAGELDRIRTLGHVGLLLEEIGHPLRTSDRLLDALPHVAQRPHRLVEELQVEEVRDEIRDGKRLVQDEPPAEVDENDRPERRGELDRGVKHGHQAQRVQERVPIADDPGPHTVRLRLLPGEGLDLADPRQVVVEGGVQFPQCDLALAERGPHVAGKPAHREHDERDGDHREERELPAHAHEDSCDAGEHEHVDEHVGDGVGDELLQEVGVVDHPRHELARLLVLVEAERQALEVAVHVVAHVGDHVPASDVGSVGARELHQGAQDVHGEGEEGEPRHEGERLRTRPRIRDRGDHRPHDPRGNELDPDQGEHARHGQHKRKPVPFCVLEDPGQSLHRPSSRKRQGHPPGEPGLHCTRVRLGPQPRARCAMRCSTPALAPPRPGAPRGGVKPRAPRRCRMRRRW